MAALPSNGSSPILPTQTHQPNQKALLIAHGSYMHPQMVLSELFLWPVWMGLLKGG